jgi:hypothetical protein
MKRHGSGLLRLVQKDAVHVPRESVRLEAQDAKGDTTVWAVTQLRRLRKALTSVFLVLALEPPTSRSLTFLLLILTHLQVHPFLIFQFVWRGCIVCMGCMGPGPGSQSPVAGVVCLGGLVLAVQLGCPLLPAQKSSKRCPSTAAVCCHHAPAHCCRYLILGVTSARGDRWVGCGLGSLRFVMLR